MALRSLASLRVLFESLPGGSKSVVPTDIQNNAPPEAETQQVLANGNNEIIVPTLAIGCVIIPDSTSILEKLLKGISGDTGIQISNTAWQVLTFQSGAQPSSIIIELLNAGEETEVVRVIWF